MESCNKLLSRDALRKSFLLTYDRMRRYMGEWHLERRLLFPAYVLLESENEERLLKELTEFRKISESGGYIVRINPEEEEFLKSLYGNECHLEMSRGILFKGAAQITEGPLKGMENRICKVDRHKRLAHIQTVMGRGGRSVPIDRSDTQRKLCGISAGEPVKKVGESRYVLVGLEITDKVE